MTSLSAADPYEWPKSTIGSKLANLEQSLVCGICTEFYENPHFLNCGHSFCSLCIRKHLDRNFNVNTFHKCPMCPERAETSHLRVNRLLQSVTTNYRSVRDDLLNLVQNGPIVSSTNEDSSNISTSKAVKVTDIRKTISQKVLHEFNTVPKMKKELLALTQSVSSSSSISTDGGLDDLKRKYRNFIALHNAQIGSAKPLTFSECVQEINRAERARATEAWTNGAAHSKIEKLKNGENVPYADAQFLALIQTARKRKKVAEDGIAGHNDKTDATEDDDTVAPVVVKTLKFVMTDDAAEQCSTGADEWQVKWSEKLGRPFFFNSKAQMGQFAVPPELEGIDINTLLQVGISGIGTEAPVSTEATSLQPQEVVISVEAPTGGRKRGRRVDESAMATQVQIPTSQAGVEIEVAEVEVSSRPPRSRRGVDVTPPPVMSPVPELNESTQSRTTRSAQKKPRLPPRRSSRTTGTDNEEVFDKEEQDQESNITEEVTEKVVEPLNEQVSAPILDSVSTLSTATIRDSVKSSQHATLPASQYDDVMRSMWETQPENSASGDSQPNLISDDEKKKLFYSDVSSKQTQEDGSQEVQLPTQVQARHSLESQSSDQSNDYPAVPGAPLINTQGSVFAVSQTIDDDDEPVLISDPDGIAGSSGSSSSSGSQYKSVSTSSGPKNWNCKHCTYLNPPLIDLCEICDKPRSPFFYAMKKEDMEAKLKKEWEKKRFTKRLGMQDLKSWKLSTSTATSSSDPSLDKSGSKLRK